MVDFKILTHLRQYSKITFMEFKFVVNTY